MGNVMVIPAKRQVGNTARQQDAKPKLRVAAYCRVSTDSDEQATSYDAQVEHYTELGAVCHGTAACRQNERLSGCDL